jgi:hypothetical protein
MSHDVTAYRPNVDRNEANERFAQVPYSDSEWIDEYDAYRSEIAVAALNRSAGNPLNQAIYLALGVYDEAYAGCSGNGIELWITVDQFRTGLDVLRQKRFEGMERPRNMADDLMGMFHAMGATVAQTDTSHHEDVTPEVVFCEKCIAFCEECGVDSLEVMFG